MLNNYILSLYWINNQLGGVKKKIYWNTFSHNGVLFPPEYNPINIPIIYKEREILLNPEAEEAAQFYAKYIDTEYVKSNRFNNNFWKDFKKLIDPKFNIESLEEIDFKKIKKYIEKEKKKVKQN